MSLTPQQAFARLKETGAFGEVVDNCNIHWYWHELPNGYKVMARQHLFGFDRAPKLFYEFHISDRLIQRKRYF